MIQFLQPDKEYAVGVTSETETIQMRDMCSADVAQVLDIEERCFVTPWSRMSFQKELANPHAQCAVATSKDRVVGYSVVWVIADEVQILNLAVSPHAQRRGIGSQLLDRIVSNARARSARSIFLEVRASSIPAIRLYETWGFRPVGKRKRYYQTEGTDALLMAKYL